MAPQRPEKLFAAPRRVTDEEIEAAKTPAGAWTKTTLESWGVPWPPPKGWRKRITEGSEDMSRMPPPPPPRDPNPPQVMTGMDQRALAMVWAAAWAATSQYGPEAQQTAAEQAVRAFRAVLVSPR